MIPIKISSSKIKIRNPDTGEFESVTFGLIKDAVNIDDNIESKSTTWSSEKLKNELDIIKDIIESNKIWSVIVDTEDSTNVHDGYVATLHARVMRGNDDVTDYFEDSAFTWYRESSDKDADAVWNALHNGHTKTLTITEDDTINNSITDFKCEVSISDSIIIH